MGRRKDRSEIVDLDPALIRQVRATPADDLGNIAAFQSRFAVSGEPISKGWRVWDANIQQWRDFA